MGRDGTEKWRNKVQKKKDGSQEPYRNVLLSTSCFVSLRPIEQCKRKKRCKECEQCNATREKIPMMTLFACPVHLTPS
jgi:hypothetical protein